MQAMTHTTNKKEKGYVSWLVIFYKAERKRIL